VTVTLVLSSGAVALGVLPAPIDVAPTPPAPEPDPDHAAALGPTRTSATTAEAAPYVERDAWEAPSTLRFSAPTWHATCNFGPAWACPTELY